MNLPFQIVHFIVYEKMQDILNFNREYNPSSHVISGAMAGAGAAAVTMPLDVCKTLLNTQECCARKQVAHISGMAEAFRTVYEFQGILGFFRGIQARIIFQMPATAISWGVYETFKYSLSKKRDAEDKYANVKGLSVQAVTVSSDESLPQPLPSS